MIKKILTAVAVTLTAVFLLFCGASADPAVTAHNTHILHAESEELSLDMTFTETDEPTETSSKITETDTDTAPTETVTEIVIETETVTEPVTETETATEAITSSIVETTAEPEELPSTDYIPETEDVVIIPPETGEAVALPPETEEAVTEGTISFDPPVKDLPLLTPSVDIDPSRPMIALTFDDGPSAHTDRLLDIFKEHGGKGTFFLVGGHIDYRPETVKRITTEGHEIGGHSINHPQLTRLSSEDVAYQLSWTRDKIYEVTGVDSYIVRPPYGEYNDEVKRIAAGLGIVFINWSIDTLDWKYRNGNTVHDRIMSSVYDGAVVLCHDIHGTTVDAMETVIPELIEMGYQLVTVSDLLSARHEVLTAGEVYNRK